MYILLILFIFILFAILCQDVIPESYKDFIDKTETNKEIPNYKNNLFVNPRKFKDLIVSKLDSKKLSEELQSEEEYKQYTTDRLELEEQSDDYNQLDRLDQKQNSYEGVQPKDLFFDIFNINCNESKGRPWSCLLVKGNTINSISRDNCKTICPEKFEKKESEEEVKIENFKNMETTPSPSHYYCYSSCKQSCIRNKYNPLEPHKNSCGQNAISQMPLDVYLSEDECMKKSFPCKNLSKDECLGKPECGWCTNGIGEGQCFPSTPSGPLNLKIPCTPSRQEPNNAFIPGRLNPFEGVGQIF